MHKSSLIYIAGHNGMVGKAIHKQLTQSGFDNIIVKNKSDLDLRNQEQVTHFFRTYRPEYVFLAAAKVGGITHNKNHPADFIRDNLLIQTNVIDSSYAYGVKKLCFLGSACIYPKLAEVPIKESSLLTGSLEETNDAYAVAKIAGYTMCKKYTEQYGMSTISLMPANLYGPNDNFRINECHVIPALIRKFTQAKQNNAASVECYGDGSPTREFLHVDDLADAALYLMENYNNPDIINVGNGVEVSIKDLAETIKTEVDYDGEIFWNTNYPNGTPRRFLDITKIKSLGWSSKIDLSEGLKDTIFWFNNVLEVNKRV
jgi:GDP-L-fucose synthase